MSEFSSKGTDPFPLLHSDVQQVGEFSEWTDQQLFQRQTEYQEFLSVKRMPRATETAGRILAHIAFELNYRIEKEIYGK